MEINAIKHYFHLRILWVLLNVAVSSWCGCCSGSCALDACAVYSEAWPGGRGQSGGAEQITVCWRVESFVLSRSLQTSIFQRADEEGSSFWLPGYRLNWCVCIHWRLGSWPGARLALNYLAAFQGPIFSFAFARSSGVLPAFLPLEARTETIPCSFAS